MDRPVPKPPGRYYSNAVPIKVGKLMFPTVGPSALKKKGILGKAGNYFSSKAKKELCLLMRVTSEDMHNKASYTVFNEEKFIWRWDSDTTSDIEKFLKTEAVGMCRHTAKMIGKDGMFKNASKGICHRTECNETLGVEDLLPKYLKAKMTPRDRHIFYLTFLEKFPPMGEIVLFDKNLRELRNNKLVVDGVQKKTIRSVLNSNGRPVWVFEIIYYSNSRLEEVKNILRPLGLNGMRNKTERGFICKYVASECSCTLGEWWSAISRHVEGESSAKYNSSNAEKVNFEGMHQGLVAANDTPAGVKTFHQQHFAMTKSQGTEVLEKKVSSPLALDQLLSMLVQLDNNKGGSYLDNYIFSLSGDTVEKLNVIANPTNKDGKTVNSYGEFSQKVMLQALSKDSLGKETSFLSPALANLGFFKPVDSVLKQLFKPEGTQELKRYFDVDKSYSYGLHNFSVAYEPSKEENCTDKLESTGAFKANFDKIIIDVNDLTPSRQVTLGNGKTLDMRNFNEIWFDNSGIVDTVSANTLKTNFFDATTREKADKKMLVEYLYDGHKDFAILSLLELVESTITRITNGQLPVNSDALMFCRLIDCIKYSVSGATNAFVVDRAFTLFTDILDIACHNKPLQGYSLQRYFFETFTEMCKNIVSAGSILFTDVAVAVLRKQLSFFISLFSETDIVINSCMLKSCYDIMEMGASLGTRKLTSRTAGLRSELVSELHRLVFEFQIPVLRAVYEQEKTKFKKNEKAGIPYILIKEFQHYAAMGDKEVAIDLTLGLLKRKADFEGAEHTTLKNRLYLKPIKTSKNALYSETIACLGGKQKSCYEFIEFSDNFPKSELGVYEPPVIKERDFKPTDLHNFLEMLKVTISSTEADSWDIRSKLVHSKQFLIKMEQPARSEITISVRANAKNIFGEKKLKELPSLGDNWKEKFMDNFSQGLADFSTGKYLS